MDRQRNGLQGDVIGRSRRCTIVFPIRSLPRHSRYMHKEMVSSKPETYLIDILLRRWLEASIVQHILLDRHVKTILGMFRSSHVHILPMDPELESLEKALAHPHPQCTLTIALTCITVFLFFQSMTRPRRALSILQFTEVLAYGDQSFSYLF